METVRAFAGLLLDIGATRRVAEYTRNLRRAATGAGWQCAWTPPPNLHITLRFLGEVDAGLVGPLGDAVATVAARVEPVTLTLGALECFPHRDNPRVLCVAVGRGSELLQRARQQLDGALAELGIPAEGRPYVPHVTLARVKAPAAAGTLLPSAVDGLTAHLHDLTLWRSDLTRAGAEHHVLRRTPLGAAARGQ
jgi:2'-5' RNA ligase